MTYDPTGNQPNDPYQYPDSQQPTSGGYYPQQPGYEGYSQPGYQQPGYQQPGYEQAGYQQPGYQQSGYTTPNYQVPRPGYPGQELPQGMAVASMVLGIASIPLLCCYVGPILGILAIIFGAIGVNQAKRGEAKGQGMAMAGLITGAVSIVLFVVFLVLYLAMGAFGSYTYY